MAHSGHSGTTHEGSNPTIRTPARQPWLAEGRGVWLALILVPILAWVVLLALSPVRAQHSTTGDPLWDELIAALAAQTSSVESSQWSYETGRTELDDAVLDSWETEFGDDPRYWMLRYHLADYSPERYRSLFIGLELDEDVSYLEAARAEGAVDGALLLYLLREYDSACRQEVYPYVQDARPQRGESNAPYLAALRGAIDERHGEEIEQLLAELRAVAPAEALPAYYAAVLETQRGDYEAAISKLHQGNNAARNSTLKGFPYEELWHGMRTGQPLEDKVVSGRLCAQSVSLALPNFISVKNMVRLLLADAAERQDLAALEEIHSYACRFGFAEGADTINCLVGCVMTQQVMDTAYRWPQPLNAQQTKALGELRNKYDQLTAELRALSSQSPWNVLGQPISLQNWLPHAEGLLTGGRSFSLMHLERLHNDTLNQQQALAGKIKQLVDEIETFDYTTLSWEQ